jgi:hypothetical protein
MMDYILLTFKTLATGLTMTSLAILITYWFELDEKLLRWFEPIFRKITE